MMASIVKLAEIALINPTIADDAEQNDELVAFVPMAAVSADPPLVSVSEQRSFSSVKTGFSYFQDGDILFAKITPCFENGKIAQARIEQQHGFGSTEFHVIRALEKYADARYILHFLRQRSIRLDGERKMTGSAGQRRVPKHFLESLKVPLPPIAQQKRIAAILDKADELRSLRRQALEQLDAIAQSIFFEMFGDPITNQKQWNTVTFGELAPEKGAIVDGPFGSSLKPESYVDSGIRVIRNFNINDVFFDQSKFVYVTEEKFREICRSNVLPGDVLLSTKGTIGDVCLMPSLPGESVLSASGTVRIRIPEESPLLPEFIIRQMIRKSYKQYIKSFESGTNQKYLNLNGIRQMELIVPPKPLQEEFICRIEAIEQLKTTHRESLAQLDALFASLQHRAFRGEL